MRGRIANGDDLCSIGIFSGSHFLQAFLARVAPSLLVKLFEVDPQDIKPEARLYEDLELDSIDAVDMIVHLQKKTGKKIKPEEAEKLAKRAATLLARRNKLYQQMATLSYEP